MTGIKEKLRRPQPCRGLVVQHAIHHDLIHIASQFEKLGSCFYTFSEAVAATLISICCVPSLGCFARSTIVPACSVVRIQIAPVPPVSANGFSPMIWPGPLISKPTVSFAMVLVRSHSF